MILGVPEHYHVFQKAREMVLAFGELVAMDNDDVINMDSSLHVLIRCPHLDLIPHSMPFYFDGSHVKEIRYKRVLDITCELYEELGLNNEEMGYYWKFKVASDAKKAREKTSDEGSTSGP